jgi:CRP-like cAMP-binding protein
LKGVELIKTHKPDLIFCDVSLPDLDGYAILNILKKNDETSHIPFIFLTGKSEKIDVRKGMNLGADDYITKPFEESELLEAIEARLEKKENLYKDSNDEGYSGYQGESRGQKELEKLCEGKKVKEYRKKEILYREDDFANYLYYINKGRIKCIKTDDYSKEFIIDVHWPGEFIGYSSLLVEGDYGETAKVMEAAEIAVIPKKEFLSLFRRNKDVAKYFMRLVIKNVRSREDRLLQLAYAPVRERLASALLLLCSKEVKKEGSILKLIVSREDLACIVGTAKESLIRTLSELKSEKFIDTDGQEISILNEAGLKNLVGNS